MIRQERAARAYAARGWVPLPLNWVLPSGACSCPRGAECGNPGKHPRVKWKERDAVTDAEIGQWWRRWPNGGVGIKTGAVSGIVVIDVDPRHGGDRTLAALEEMHGALPPTLTARTGGGGLHIVFQHPGVRVQNVQNDETRKLGSGLDVRGDGGQIAAAPTVHASRRRYEWVDWTAPVLPMPVWLLDRLTRPRPEPSRSTAPRAALGGLGAGVLADRARAVAGAVNGDRNSALYRHTFYCAVLVRQRLLTEPEVRAAMERAAEDAGLTASEAEATIDSAFAGAETAP